MRSNSTWQREPRSPRRVRGLALQVLAAVASGLGGVFLGHFLGALSTPMDGVGMTLSALFALAGAGGTVVLLDRTHREAQAVERRREKNLTRFNDLFVSCIQAVEELLASERDARAGEEFFMSLLRSGCTLFRQDGVRLCVYTFEEGEEGDFLRLQKSSGRGDKPRAEFIPGTPHGDSVIGAVRAGKAIPVSDPSRPPQLDRPIVVDHHEHTVWQSFMLIPLRGEREVLGSLMVDTRERTAWSYEDLAVAETIARLLTIGMGQMRRGGIDTGPEVRQAVTELKQLNPSLKSGESCR